MNVILFTSISIIRASVRYVWGGLVETYAIYSYCGEVTQAVFGPPRFGPPVLDHPF